MMNFLRTFAFEASIVYNDSDNAVELRRIQMKKKLTVVIVILVTLIATLWGGYVLYDSIFPKAEPIRQIEIGELDMLSMYNNANEEIALSDTELQRIINYINSAVPTRIISVNDYPGVRPYYVIEIKTAQRLLRYMIYEENGTAYVELPYEGVYEVDREAVEILQ